MPYTVECSDDPPRIHSHFMIDIPLREMQAKPDDYPMHDPASFIHITCNDKVLKGKFELQMGAKALQVTFRPDRQLNPLQPEDEILIRTGPKADDEAHTFDVPFRDLVAITVDYSGINFGPSAVALIRDNASGDFLEELRTALAKNAGVSVDRIGAITGSSGEEITDHYDVSALDQEDCLCIDILDNKGKKNKRASSDDDDDKEEEEESKEPPRPRAARMSAPPTGEQEDNAQEDEEDEEADDPEDMQEEAEGNEDDDVRTSHNSESEAKTTAAASARAAKGSNAKKKARR